MSFWLFLCWWTAAWSDKNQSSMVTCMLFIAWVASWGGPAEADTVYKCGTTYTNEVRTDCKALYIDPQTNVVQAYRPALRTLRPIEAPSFPQIPVTLPAPVQGGYSAPTAPSVVPTTVYVVPHNPVTSINGLPVYPAPSHRK